MGAKRNVHVVPKSGGWAVRTEGASRASSVHTSKGKAVAVARSQARAASTQLVIHSKSGLISDRDSYVAKDPLPPKDKKK